MVTVLKCLQLFYNLVVHCIVVDETDLLQGQELLGWFVDGFLDTTLRPTPQRVECDNVAELNSVLIAPTTVVLTRNVNYLVAVMRTF